MALFRALAVRPFALLWGGRMISRLGDSFYAVALAWWVLTMTGSATAMGTVLICSSVPMLVLLLAGSVAVERLPRLTLLLTSDAVRGGVVGIMALLAAQHELHL